MQEAAEPVQLITVSQQCHLCVQGKWLCLQVKHIQGSNRGHSHSPPSRSVSFCEWIKIDLFFYSLYLFNIFRIYIHLKALVLLYTHLWVPPQASLLTGVNLNESYKARFILFICATELHCCPIVGLLKTHQRSADCNMFLHYDEHVYCNLIWMNP